MISVVVALAGLDTFTFSGGGCRRWKESNAFPESLSLGCALVFPEFPEFLEHSGTYGWCLTASGLYPSLVWA